MQLVKLFVISAVLIGRLCLSKTLIEINTPGGFNQLEEAAINLLTTCYANKDKTIVLVGDSPGTFVKRLSDHQLFSVVLLDDTRRPKDTIDYYYQRQYRESIHQVHVVVMFASSAAHYIDLRNVLYSAPYYDSMGFFLILGWSAEKKYAGCNGLYETVDFMYFANRNNILNLNFMCHDRKRVIVIYSSNPFINQAPEPWQLVKIMKLKAFPNFSYYMREYREHERMCENLHFDRTNNLGRLAIKVSASYSPSIDNIGKEAKSLQQLQRSIKGSTFSEDGIARIKIATNNVRKSKFLKIGDDVDIESFRNQPSMLKRLDDETKEIKVDYSREWLEYQKHTNFFDHFLDYVNATKIISWKSPVVGTVIAVDDKTFSSKPTWIRGTADRFYTYPYERNCVFLMSQFRGNKSQLRKLVEVIDIYSWYCLSITCLCTVIFFKYFLGQSLLEGFLNLLRVALTIGLQRLPGDTASRIYLVAFFSVMLTMQGIFVGNLAALLTQDTPVRQVNSIEDLAELNYTVYIPDSCKVLFQDPIFDGRVIILLANQNCRSFVLRAPWIACLYWGGATLEYASKHNLHVGKDCITTEYVCNAFPWQWSLEERLNNFLKIIIGGGVMTRFDAIVVEKRSLEAETEDVPIEPRIMTLDDLGFTFVILGIGLGIASITFICEFLVYRFHHRVRTSQSIVLKLQVKPRLLEG